jgi:glycosyltransferase involved in cell wall biosynthesis
VRRPRVAHVTTVDVTLRFLLLPQLRRLRDEGYEVTTISAPGPWVSDLEREGIRHIPWPGATRAWDPRADLRAIRHLVGILRRERFDVVHTHNPKPGFIGRLAARMVGTPVVVNTVHGLWATPEDRVRRRLPVLALEWLAARFSHMELYQSEEDLRWARRTRVARRERSILLGNGTDLRHFHPEAVPPETVARLRAELGIPEDALVVGIVARMVAEKGYREFLETARTLRSTSPEVRFIAVGGWDLEHRGSFGLSGPPCLLARDALSQRSRL